MTVRILTVPQCLYGYCNDMTDDTTLDPKENPEGTGHLPVSGEGGTGKVPYHDPLTIDTDDSVEED